MANSNQIDFSLSKDLVEEILKSDLSKNPNGQEELKNKLLKVFQVPLPLKGQLSEVELEKLINKYDTIEIRKIKIRIKDLLEKDTIKSLRELKGKLKEDCTLYDDITGLIARYNRIDRYLHKGTIKYSDAHLEFTKIDNSIIMMVNELDKEDLKE